jgi:hypothetical protein
MQGGRGWFCLILTAPKLEFGLWGYVFRDAMAESTEEMTPLKQKLDEFGRFLSKVSMRMSDPCYGPPTCLVSLYIRR